MGDRSVIATVEAHRQLEGAGFVVRRPFPSPRLSHVDPFLLLDEMGPVDLAPGEARGAPDHPHRGFETVTYVLEGAIEHEDSAGHAGRIGPGAVQWMTAGAGVIHSELPARELVTDGGRSHGFQVWVNLPAARKMTPPRYQELAATEIPTVVLDGVEARVVAGEFAGALGPVETSSPITYVHLRLAAGATATVDAPAERNALVYTFAGDGDGTLRIHDHDGDTLTVRNGGRVLSEHLVLVGSPLGEPIARYGPFVMSTREEIVAAIEDYESGRFGSIAR